MTKIFDKIVTYPTIWKPESKRDLTEQEKSSVKSCKVVQVEVSGNLGVEFCLYEKSKGKHIRTTLTVWYKDEDKFHLNQRLNMDELALLTVVSNTGNKVLRVTLK